MNSNSRQPWRSATTTAAPSHATTLLSRSTRRAAARQINYAESDVGDDDPQNDFTVTPDDFSENGNDTGNGNVSDDASEAPLNNRRKRPSPSKKVSPPKRKSPAKPAARRTRRRASHASLSSNSSMEEDSNTESETEMALARRNTSTRGRGRGGRGTLALARQSKSRAASKKIDVMPTIEDRDVYSRGIIPDWTALPYMVLRRIMEYVGDPLMDEGFRATDGWKHVLTASKVCTKWTEPALSVLWRSPVMTPLDRAHGLLKQLRAHPSHTALQYRQKLISLKFEIQLTAAYSYNGRPLDLAALAYYAPMLRDLEIHHYADFAPYRTLDEPVKWQYPQELFEALQRNIDGVPTRLKSWRWSSRLVKKIGKTTGYDFDTITRMHLSPAFKNLEKLVYVNYQTPDLPKVLPADFVPAQTEKKLAETIALLPSLKHLTFEACSLANGKLLELLTSGLEHIEFTACNELTSDDLASFLLRCGRKLKTLTLAHNQALSLSFLTVLKEACPNLQELRANLSYYNLHGTYRDNEPTFSTLITADAPATWPTTLRTIEFLHLRKWNGAAAEAFFRSLLVAGKQMGDLRSINIKASLDAVPWRERSQMRDKYADAFRRVYKQQISSPNEHHRSIGEFEHWKNEKLRADVARALGISQAISIHDSDSDVRSIHSPLPIRRKLWDGRPETAGSITYTGTGTKRSLNSSRLRPLQHPDSVGIGIGAGTSTNPVPIPSSPEKLVESTSDSDSDRPVIWDLKRDNARRKRRQLIRNLHAAKGSDSESENAIVETSSSSDEDRPIIWDLKRDNARRVHVPRTRAEITAAASNAKQQKDVSPTSSFRFSRPSSGPDDPPTPPTPVCVPNGNANGGGNANGMGPSSPKRRKLSHEMKWLKERAGQLQSTVESTLTTVNVNSFSLDDEEESDDRPIALRRPRRAAAGAAGTPLALSNVKVVIDGHKTKTPGGTMYGDSRGQSVEYVDRNASPSKGWGLWLDAKDGELQRQGLCKVVELRIDSSRPSEHQFTEADFMDDEPSDDDEWDGTGGLMEDGHYAW